MALNNRGRLKRINKGRVHHVLFILGLIKGRLKGYISDGLLVQNSVVYFTPKPGWSRAQG